MHKNRHFWAKLTLSAALAPVPLWGQLNSDIAGYWPLDSDLTDNTSLGGDGTFLFTGGTGTPAFTSGGPGSNTAQFGEAIALSSANGEYITIDGAGNASFAGDNAYDFSGGSMSVSVWCTTTAGFTSNWQGLVAKGEGSSWRLSRLSDQLGAAFAGGLGNTSAEGTTDLTTGLYHVVAVSDKDRGVYLYVDGALESYVAGNPVITDSTFNMAIGNNPQNPDRFWDGTIDDVILFGRPLSGPEVATIFNGGVGTSGADIIASLDSDSDGIPDFYENSNGLNSSVNDSAGDLDSDNLSNLDEYLAGLGANNPDADGDGLLDGDEAANNADPFIADTDGDGLSDGDEVNTHGTLADNVDSDNDQASDFDEVSAGTNPNDDTDFPSSWRIGLKGYWSFDDNLSDTSGSGADGTFKTLVVDGTPTYTSGKFGNGILLDEINDEYVAIESVPESTFDFTGQSMSASLWCSNSGFTTGWQALLAKGEGTSWRVARSGTSNNASFNPGDWSADGDDLTGGDISDGTLHHVVVVTDINNTGQLWVDGVKVAESTAPPIIGNTTLNLFIGANPGAPVADGYRSWNGVIDEVAIWNRPLSVGEIGQLYSNGTGATVQSLIEEPDTDGDGLPDSWEIAFSTDRFVDDKDEDPDNDGSTNIQEFEAGTSPQDEDSDDDGLKDGDEATLGTSPLIADTDGDSLKDGDEVNLYNTNPLKRDSDSDGHADAVELEFGSDPNLDTSIPSLDQGLLGYWPLDADLTDATNNGGNGSYQDNLLGAPNFTTGKFGNGINLVNANRQYVVIDGQGGVTTPPDYTQAGESISISVWTSVSSFVGNWQGLVARGEGSAWRIAGRGPNGDPEINGQYAYAGGIGDITSPLSYDDGQFHHIVAVSEKGVSARLYIDGVQVATNNSPPVLTDNGNNNFITIGNNPDALDRSWDGIVDDVAIWSRPLTPTEIAGISASSQSLGQQIGLGTPDTVSVTSIVRASDGSINLTWTSGENATYSILFTTDLSQPLDSWTEIDDNVSSDGSSTSATVAPVRLGGAPKGFFVVRKN